MSFEDIVYEVDDSLATINRPKVLNAFRAQTVDELVEAFKDAWGNRSIGVVILMGAGDRAFCTGGDQSVREGGGATRASPRAPTSGSMSRICIRSSETFRSR